MVYPEDTIILKDMNINENFASWLIAFANEGGDWQYAIEKPWKYIDEYRDWLDEDNE